jgi:hypothetical protein
MEESRGGSQVIEAQKLILRDEHGKVRVILSAESPNVGIRLLDSKEKSRIQLTLSDEGAMGLQFFDDAGTARMVAALDPDSEYTATPTLALSSKGGNGSIVAYASSDGVNSIAFYDKSKKLAFLIPQWLFDPDHSTS